jgi:hypothetical protein
MIGNLLDYIKERLKEASTWRGLVLCATAAGATISPAWAEGIITLGLALAGGIGVVSEDK